VPEEILETPSTISSKPQAAPVSFRHQNIAEQSSFYERVYMLLDCIGNAVLYDLILWKMGKVRVMTLQSLTLLGQLISCSFNSFDNKLLLKVLFFVSLPRALLFVLLMSE
jgi:hypothetical protein